MEKQGPRGKLLVTFWIDAELKARVAALAQREDKSVSALIRRALRREVAAFVAD